MPVKSKKKGTRKKPTVEESVFPTRVRVRMYRQGLGECFLLTFPRLGMPFHVLIECGVTMGTPDAAALMQTVARDILQQTRGRLDIVVATHPHWDKTSGFIQAQSIFDQMEMGEVWLGWTEDPKEPSNRAKREFASRTKDAIDYLRNRGKALRYLRGGDGPLNLEGVAGVRVFILGPPTQAAYRGLKEQAIDKLYAASSPFDSKYHISPRAAREIPAFSAYFGTDTLEDDEHWRNISRGLAQGEVRGGHLGLDSAVNDASLVMAFELTGDKGESKVLLFPGDAQTASWNTWHDYVWPAKASPDDPKAVTCRKLLQQTVLYKASHYGSHSGTPSRFGLDLMTNPELTVMISVDHAAALRKRWIMPAPDLLAVLFDRARGRVIRADRGVPETLETLSEAEREEFQQSVNTTELYIDYSVEIPQLTAAERATSEAKWIAANDRRAYLIDKKLAGTIKPSEEAELRELEQLMDEYLSVVAPTGFGLLSELKQTVEALKTRPQRR